MRHDNIVWITGATSGIGEALARTCPWPDTRIISVSRREHPDFETVNFDLTDMSSWDKVGEHLTEQLATFRGKRAVFIHNALWYWGRAYQGEGDHATHVKEFMANCVAAIALGDLFLRAAPPAVEAGVDVGLVQMSSASARIVHPGYAIYGASKAAVEQWVRNGNMLAADESANLIWDAIPEQTKAKPVLLFGEPVGITAKQ